MHLAYSVGITAAAAPAIVATAGEYSSDEILVERIAVGDKLAMQGLFARHRTLVYRWLNRFFGSRALECSGPLPSYPCGSSSVSREL